MKLPYFKIKEAFNEAKDSFSYGSGSDKLSATAKLVGKSVANVGMLAAEAGMEFVKRAPEIAGQMAKQNLDKHSHLMSDEQKEKAQQEVRAGNEARERRWERERQKEEEEARKQKEAKED